MERDAGIGGGGGGREEGAPGHERERSKESCIECVTGGRHTEGSGVSVLLGPCAC
jgi:hypothetical protein